MPSIEYFGGAGEVTGSCMSVKLDTPSGQRKIGFDLGSYVGGNKEESLVRNALPLIDRSGRDLLSTVNHFVLSHPHQDHCGRFIRANLEKFRGRIFTTVETEALLGLMLDDAVKITNSERFTGKLDAAVNAAYGQEKLEKRGKGRGDRQRSEYGGGDNNSALRRSLISMLRSKIDTSVVPSILERVYAIDYGVEKKIERDIRLTFLNAGHILGSAMSLLEAREGSRAFTLLNSHDLGNSQKDSYLGPPDEVTKDVDALTIEATYGDRLHEEREPKLQLIFSEIVDTLKKGGRVIIPAFALERSQELLMYFADNIQKINSAVGRKVPIVLDSKLARSVTEVYERFSKTARYNSTDLRKLGDITRYGDFHFLDNETRGEFILENPSCIIISSSGMCEAGPIREHLVNGLGDPKNLVMFSGYPGTGSTLANRIISASKRPEPISLKINSVDVPVNARVMQAGVFSSHADQSDLLEFVEQVPFKGEDRRDAKIFIQHSPVKTANAFKELLLEKFYDLKPENVIVPKVGQVYNV